MKTVKNIICYIHVAKYYLIRQKLYGWNRKIYDMYQHFMIKCLPCKTHNWGTKEGSLWLCIVLEYQRISKNIKEY